MAMAVSCLVGTALMCVEFGVLACSAQGSRRRSRFYIRLSGACLFMSGLALGVAFAINSGALPQRAFGLVWVVLLLAALAVAPVFCYHTFVAFPSSPEGDGGGGGGPGSGPPPPAPGPSRGGAPLLDAEQARARRRGDNRPSRRGVSRRRPAFEPARPRAPSAPGPPGVEAEVRLCYGSESARRDSRCRPAVAAGATSTTGFRSWLRTRSMTRSGGYTTASATSTSAGQGAAAPCVSWGRTSVTNNSSVRRDSSIVMSPAGNMKQM